jgi:hypothetical protein
LLRPAVPVRFAGPFGTSESFYGLVDSGSDHTLAAPWIAQAIGADVETAKVGSLQVGGQNRQVRFTEVRVILAPPGGSADDAIEWEAEVGFFTRWEPLWGALLGQIGFFDQFMVTMGRMATVLALEAPDEMDRRFGVRLADPPTDEPRFRS